MRAISDHDAPRLICREGRAHCDAENNCIVADVCYVLHNQAARRWSWFMPKETRREFAPGNWRLSRCMEYTTRLWRLPHERWRQCPIHSIQTTSCKIWSSKPRTRLIQQLMMSRPKFLVAGR